LGMLLEEFDVKKYERSLREEGREEGIEVGRKEGQEEESARYSKLICILLEQHREDDLRRAAKEPTYRKQLFEEFRL
ncbi:MAG: hypothetical protein K2K87_06825, partial [Lachnospiraceae bacterium]|nr:hypothetical protein [Lachnospiraceae bacterium]